MTVDLGVVQLAHELGGCEAAVAAGADPKRLMVRDKELTYTRCSACPPETIRIAISRDRSVDVELPIT